MKICLCISDKCCKHKVCFIELYLIDHFPCFIGHFSNTLYKIGWFPQVDLEWVLDLTNCSMMRQFLIRFSKKAPIGQKFQKGIFPIRKENGSKLKCSVVCCHFSIVSLPRPVGISRWGKSPSFWRKSSHRDCQYGNDFLS